MHFCAETLLMSFIQLPVMMFYAVKPENATKVELRVLLSPSQWGLYQRNHLVFFLNEWFCHRGCGCEVVP